MKISMRVVYQATTWEGYGYALRAYLRGYAYYRNELPGWRMT